MLLEIESELGRMIEPNSLADRVLDGLVSRYRMSTSTSTYPSVHIPLAVEASPEPFVASDYVSTLLRDATSSHLLETLARQLPSDFFEGVWTIYFKSKLARLAVHPVANFVVGKALERVDDEQLDDACEELLPAAQKLFSK